MIKRATIFIQALLIVVLLNSCSSGRMLKNFARDISGTWELKTIVTEGITEKVTLQLFNETDFQCFIGSRWKFDEQGGSYTISSSLGTVPCSLISRAFHWTLYGAKDKPSLLVLKRLDAEMREIDPSYIGYILLVKEIGARQMSLRSDITYNGKPAALIYNFIKIN